MIFIKEHTCFFTGHRSLPQNKIADITNRLNIEIDNLISKGVMSFISGGALGFDQLASAQIIEKRESCNIRLVLALPCKNQDILSTDIQKRLYRSLLAEADEIVYVSDKYDDGCMKRRNFYMAEQSACCICSLLDSKSGTGQTVNYSQKIGIHIINVVESNLPVNPI